MTSRRAKAPVMTSKSRAESAGPIGAWRDAGLFSSASREVVVTSSRPKPPVMTAKSRAESAGPLGGRSGRWLIKPHNDEADDRREGPAVVTVERKVKVVTSRARDSRGRRVNVDGSSSLARAASTEDSRHTLRDASAPQNRRASLGAKSRRARTDAGTGAGTDAGTDAGAHAAGGAPRRRDFPST